MSRSEVILYLDLMVKKDYASLLHLRRLHGE